MRILIHLVCSPMCAGLLLTLGIAVPAWAQQNQPRIGYVFPAGGARGSTFEVTVGGQRLKDVSAGFVSGGDIEIELLDYVVPLSPSQVSLLRDKLKELTDRRAAATQPFTAEDEKSVEEIKKKLAAPLKRQVNPAIAETVTLRITAGPKAAAGMRELRLYTPAGLTNPLAFCIGVLPEVQETETGVDRDRREQEPRKPDRFGKAGPAPEPPTEVKLPAVLNGQIMAGDVDRYQFTARKGQGLVFVTAARDLIPYLPDAVPGWFQATMRLLDADGNEVAYCDDYRFRPDPVILYRVPRDGEYILEIHDSIYRGREDFAYRISAGCLPFVTGIFPLGGKVGERNIVEMTGWNLPSTRLTQDATQAAPGVVMVCTSKNQASNRVPFMLDALAGTREKEPNNDPAKAQKVDLPVLIDGRIDRPGDADVFQFEGHAGEEIVAEVYARRLDSPLDSGLSLMDATGRQLAFNDDSEDKGAGLETHHADSLIRFKLAADGSYTVRLTDQQGKGGPEYGYRLRISRPQPDFGLRVVPSCASFRGPGAVTLTAYALRKDGFAGEIALALRDALPGMKLKGGRIPAGEDQVRFTLTAPERPLNEPVVITIEGRATIEDSPRVHAAVPAEDMMQAFAYRHLVPANELLVTASGRVGPKSQIRIVSELPVRIPAGGTARVRVAGGTKGPKGDLHLELSEPPEGISIVRVSHSSEGAEILLKSDASKARPGQQGNLIVHALADSPPDAKNKKPQNNQKRAPVATLPAIPFEVVAK